jgi:exosortase D (VPLPA-CTERM-specific)
MIPLQLELFEEVERMINVLKSRIHLRVALYFCIYSALIVGLYYGTLDILFYQLRIWEDYNYGYLIPLVALYLIWEKRDQLDGTQSIYSFAGLLFAIAGLCLFWVGELGGELFMQYISLWMVISGLTWMHLGWTKVRIILFPILFMLTMFPLPHFVTAKLTLKLKLISSKLGVMVLQALGHTAYREGNVIDLGFTQLQVVDACSGLRYLIPLIVLSIVVVYFYRSAWWKKTLVVLSAVPISILVNGLRIASVGLLYPVWGPKVAEGFFHDFSGWLIFMLSMGVLLAEMWLLNLVFKESGRSSRGLSSFEAQPLSEGKRNPTVGLLPKARKSAIGFKSIPVHFWIVSFLLVVSLAAGHAIEFREKKMISKPLDQFPLEISSWTGTSQQMDGQILSALHLTDYAMIDYSNDQGKTVNLYVAYYGSQQKAESIHSPSTCLPAGGWVFRQAGKTNVRLTISGTAMPVNKVIMQKGGSQQLVYYWFPMRGRILTNAYQMKLFNFWDALTRQRTDGALVRVITPLYENEPLYKAEERIEKFLGDVVPLLNGYLPE